MIHFYFSDGTHCKKFEFSSLTVLSQQEDVTSHFHFPKRQWRTTEILFADANISRKFIKFANLIHKGTICIPPMKNSGNKYTIMTDCYLSSYRSEYENGNFASFVEITHSSIFFTDNEADLRYFKTTFDKELLLEKLNILSNEK